MLKMTESANVKILIVDDEPQNVMLLEEVLKQAGYSSLRSATDPREVPAIYRDFQPDLALLDLNMPYMDGFQVMEEIRKFEPGSYLPVLILTARTDRATRLKALNAGALDFLAKPLDILEVVCRIRNLSGIRRLHQWEKNQSRALEEEVRIRTRQLRETQLEIIRRLSLAGEYRDNETAMHVFRMSHYSACLGRGLGLPERFCELLLNASPMHDIGKIGIPDRILLKPGKLDPEEMAIMKTHAKIGAGILSNSDNELVRMGETIALRHHERYDGGGYPNGLKGDAIPLAARIVAVCDVFDALTSKRPYKKAWPAEEAMEELNRRSGSHLDPRLVEKFNEILPEILEIKNSYPDRIPAEPAIMDDVAFVI
ncbi:MAG: response regulator [Nitrospinae bacterium]|nr:response regulator [Nitrospinota bacterium]